MCFPSAVDVLCPQSQAACRTNELLYLSSKVFLGKGSMHWARLNFAFPWMLDHRGQQELTQAGPAPQKVTFCGGKEPSAVEKRILNFLSSWVLFIKEARIVSLITHWSRSKEN